MLAKIPVSERVVSNALTGFPTMYWVVNVPNDFTQYLINPVSRVLVLSLVKRYKIKGKKEFYFAENSIIAIKYFIGTH